VFIRRTDRPEYNISHFLPVISVLPNTGYSVDTSAVTKYISYFDVCLCISGRLVQDIVYDYRPTSHFFRTPNFQCSCTSLTIVFDFSYIVSL